MADNDNEDNLVTSNMAEDVTICVSNVLPGANKEKEEDKSAMSDSDGDDVQEKEIDDNHMKKDEEFHASLISTNENINHENDDIKHNEETKHNENADTGVESETQHELPQENDEDINNETKDSSNKNPAVSTKGDHEIENGSTDNTVSPEEESINNDDSNLKHNAVSPEVVKNIKNYDSNLEYQLKSNNVLFQTYLAQIENLDAENRQLKVDLAKYESSTGEETRVGEEHSRSEEESNTVESKFQQKIAELKEETSSLQEKLSESQKQYTEAILALEEVQNAYGDERDVVLRKYEREVVMLQEKVRMLEENEGVITRLRQEVLDIQLLLEKTKKSHKDQLAENERSRAELKQQMEESNEKASIHTEAVHAAQDALAASEKLANERMEKIIQLNTELVLVNDSLKLHQESCSAKNAEIDELKKQLYSSAEMLEKEHTSKISLSKQLEEVSNCNHEMKGQLEDLKYEMKLREMKIKFSKKQVKSLEQEKQKADSLMFVLPEMQKKIELLEKENQRLQQKVQSHDEKEQERINKIESERRFAEKQMQNEKGEWERNTLGIGQCVLDHEGDDSQFDLSDSFSRPRSAPLLKPRPPTAKRENYGQYKSLHKGARTLSPTYLRRSIEGRHAAEKVRLSHKKIIFANKNKKNQYQSVSEPIQLNNSFNYGEEKSLPISSKYNPHPNMSPRVLVWGNSHEGPGKKLVAVGDRVLTNVLQECAQHGRSQREHTGVIKFIGFIEGNDKDVYIGVRLDDKVGTTDGKIEGRRYFRCEPKRGKIVHLDDIVKVLESQHP
ncbi:centrosomal protein of 112 kDa-like isoform X2 [Hydractinia symbiolongicarpus]|uniref:centrosomal protein of 112 kDa-like isoform X2 n=1 Tax=Hydractinia symbiolongicarpus TaxID=13093 RepID=UPI00254F87F4|nr:centrosomal protein of 112 kDa-like isoform X2 [Hydractinia symbiolongicarpus]